MNKSTGFTLIELISVLTIVGIVGAIVLSKYPGTNSANADGFAGVFLQSLRYTKVLSMSQNQRYRMVIGASSYQIQNQSSVNQPNPETGAASTSYPSGVTVTPTTTVIFDSLGKPYNGAGTALSSTLTFTVQSGSQSKTVSISPESGFIQ